MRLSKSVVFLLAFPSLVAAQGGPAFDWRIPIHRDSGGQLWASGPDYKVGFDRSVLFVPVLGSDEPEPVSWSWRTDSVRIGEAVLATDRDATSESFSDWRYERRWSSGVREVYEVRLDGVEQKFILEHAPRELGDVVIRGRISGLSAQDQPALDSRRALDFVDSLGRSTVHYGAATAFDAAGDAAPVTTRYAEQHIELRLHGEWLRNASFPVTIDPLLTSKRYAGGAPSVVDVTATRGTGEMLMTVTRAASGSDWDFAAVELDSSMSVTGTVITDLTTVHSTRYAQCSIARRPVGVPTAERWLVAAQRDSARGGGSRVWVYAQTVGASLNSGTWKQVLGTSNASQRYPSISSGRQGSFGGIDARVVYQEDLGIPAQSTSSSTIWSASFHPTSEQVGSPVLLAASSGIVDNEYPQISRSSSGSTCLVVWQARVNGTGTNWNVNAATVDASGTPIDLMALATTSDNEIHPIVDGESDRFVVAFTRRELSPTLPSPSNAGFAILAQRVDVDRPSGTITAGARHEIARSTGINRLTTAGGSRGIAFDFQTDSHWAVAYTSDGRLLSGTRSAYVTRIGYRGQDIETATLQQGTSNIEAFGPSVAFNSEQPSFPVVWASTSQSPSGLYYAWGNVFTYGTSLTIPFGTQGCSGTLSAWNAGQQPARPHAGSQFFEMRLTGSLPNAPTLMMLGADTSLSLQVSPSCFLWIGPVPIIYSSGISDGAGSFEAPVPIPENVIGEIYWQALQLDPTLGTLVTSTGLALQIR